MSASTRRASFPRRAGGWSPRSSSASSNATSATITPPSSRKSSTTSPAAALDWQKLLEAFWRDFKPKAGEVMEQKPSEVTAALDEFLAPWLYPPREDGTDPRAVPGVRQRAAVAARRQVRRVRRLLQLSRVPLHAEVRPGRRGRRRRSEGPQELGNGIELKTGRFGPYVERATASARRIPKDVPVADVDAEMAEKLLSLPREIGAHPETGKPITASIGRYGPYLEHDGKYARLELDRRGVRDRHERRGRQACRRGFGRGPASKAASREPIAVLGAHPSSGKEIKVMEGRYGPYVSDGTTHATLPKTADPKSVTLEQAVEWIDAKAAKGPSAREEEAGAEEEGLGRAGPAVRVLRQADLPPVERDAVEQEQACRRRRRRCRRWRGWPSARRSCRRSPVSAPSTPSSAQVSQSSASNASPTKQR